MLGRAILPRVRPRLYPPPIRLATAYPQKRCYARDRRPKSDADYQLPPTARQPDWKTQPPALKASGLDPGPEPRQEEEFHELSPEEYVEVAPEERPREIFQSQRLPVQPRPQPLDPKNEFQESDTFEAERPRSTSPPTEPRHDFQESVPFEAERVQPEVEPVEYSEEELARLREEQIQTEAEPAEQTEEELARLRAALPDITQGIPSTLAAELSQARSNQKGASPASLNITEDPNEPTPPAAGGRGGGDGLPKSSYISTGEQKRNRLVKWVYAALLLSFVGYSAYLGRNWDDEEEEKKHEGVPSGWGLGLFYDRVKARLNNRLNYYSEPMALKLLPDENKDPNLRFPFTLVLSLEDMLIHNEWTREHGWRVAKRPGLDYFLRYLSQYYELVLFTSQPSSMADQVLRKLDPYTIIQLPLFREATLYKDGGYIKDISYLNRPQRKVIMLDTEPHHVKHQPENAIVLPKWKGDPNDQTLVQLIPFLEYLATMGFDDSRPVLKSFEGTFIPAEFARREKSLREKFYEKRQAEGKGRKKPSVAGVAGALGWKSNKPQLIDPTTGKPIKEEPLEGDKMLWDQIRERGQAQYMAFEKQIREEGEKWLKERAEEEKKLQDEAMKNMKTGFLGYFGMGSGEKK